MCSQSVEYPQKFDTYVREAANHVSCFMYVYNLLLFFNVIFSHSCIAVGPFCIICHCHFKTYVIFYELTLRYTYSVFSP